MDISDTLAPDSDQLDAIDLEASGPRVFTIAGVSKGNAEQPVNIKLAEFDRPWRPGKSMRRVLASCWGVDAAQWTGRKVQLYCDPNVRFGGDVVMGTRIKALSHIDKTRKVPLLISRGKSATYTVEPLKEAAPTADPTTERIATLRAEFRTADETRKAAILAEVKDLQGEPAAPEPHKFAGTDDLCEAAGCGLALDAECHR